jgi:hypothetical protein
MGAWRCTATTMHCNCSRAVGQYVGQPNQPCMVGSNVVSYPCSIIWTPTVPPYDVGLCTSYSAAELGYQTCASFATSSLNWTLTVVASCPPP